MWTVKTLVNGIVNGDFSAGNSAITSEAAYSTVLDYSIAFYSIQTKTTTPAASPLTKSPVSTYAHGTWYDETVAATSPTAAAALSLFDGQYFLASMDGKGTAAAPFKIWQQSVNVVQGQTYDFTFDYMTQYIKVVSDSGNRTAMDVVINGETIMTTKAGSAGVIHISYTAPITGSIPLTFQSYSAWNGSDVAFDDMVFAPVAPAVSLTAGGAFGGATPNPDTLTFTGGVLDTMDGADTISAGTNLQTLLAAGGNMLDGGAKVDTLKLAAGTTLDLVALTHNQTVKTIQEIEVFQLQGTSKVTLDANNVLSLGGTELTGYSFTATTQTAIGNIAATGSTSSKGKVQFVVNGTLTDTVDMTGLAVDGVTGTAGVQGNTGLTGQWDYKGQVVLGGKTYKIYDHSTTQGQLLIELPINTIVAGPDAPKGVLDPATDSGTKGDSSTTDNTPTISGAGGNPGGHSAR
eukprot:gene27042-33704_t